MEPPRMQSLPQEDPSVGYYREAVTGSTEAYRSLRETALAAGVTGEVSTLESLVAAECYARLAVSVGDDEDRRRLVMILLDRATERGDRNGQSDFFRLDAAHYLKMLADRGDAAAANDLDALGFGPVWEEDAAFAVARRSVEEFYADAARGDVATLFDLVEAAIGGKTHDVITFEEMVHAEQLARLGSFTDDVGMRTRLAGILFVRCAYEANITRDRTRAYSAAIEALGLLLGLISDGVIGVEGHVQAAVDLLSIDELVAFTGELPDLLRYVQPEGMA